MPVLIYRQGGTLALDERLETQPSSCTFTLRTLQDAVLSTLHSSFDDVEAESATVDTLTLTLAATARNANQISVVATSGTGVSHLTSDGYRLLVVDVTGRKQWFRVNGVAMSGSNVETIYIDDRTDFALTAGSTAYAVRCSYAVDWSAVTATYTGEVKGTWKVTVGGVVRTFTKVYDIVRQELVQPASWSDVIALRPDADSQTSNILDKEDIVKVAWEHLIRDMRTMGMLHNLIVPDGSTGLRDALVYQTLYNLAKHQGLTVPPEYAAAPDMYRDELIRDRNQALSGLTQIMDLDEDGKLDADELSGISRQQVWFRRRPRVRG